MPLRLKVFNHYKCKKARKFSVLAFFVCVCLVIQACRFDNSSGVNSDVAIQTPQRGTVIKVKDGDSVVLRFAGPVEKEARLFGIDALAYRYL